jgi:uncharacterized membrane protein
MSLHIMYQECFRLERDKSKQMATQWVVFMSALGGLYGFYFSERDPYVILIIPVFMIMWAIFMIWTSVYTQGLRIYLEYLEKKVMLSESNVDRNFPLWFSDVRPVIIHRASEYWMKTPLEKLLFLTLLPFVILIYVVTIVLGVIRITEFETFGQVASYIYTGLHIVFAIFIGLLAMRLYDIYSPENLVFSKPDWKNTFGQLRLSIRQRKTHRNSSS